MCPVTGVYVPHTGSHVGEHMETPHVDEFMLYYNAIVGQSSYAVVHFSEITGYTAKKKSATRWFSTNDVQELSLLPNATNGNLLKWADKLIGEGLCDKMAPKLRSFLLGRKDFVQGILSSGLVGRLMSHYEGEVKRGTRPSEARGWCAATRRCDVGPKHRARDRSASRCLVCVPPGG